MTRLNRFYTHYKLSKALFNQFGRIFCYHIPFKILCSKLSLIKNNTALRKSRAIYISNVELNLFLIAISLLSMKVNL